MTPLGLTTDAQVHPPHLNGHTWEIDPCKQSNQRFWWHKDVQCMAGDDSLEVG